MAKQIVFEQQARELLLRGIDQVADAVAITLGPKGRNVALDKGFGAPTVTHDGVTVVNEVALANAFQNMGAQLVKEAASKTNDLVGDGTTTAIVLAQAMVHTGMRNLAAGANPMLLKKGIQAAVNMIVDHLVEQSIPINTHSALAQVARISAQDPEMGELIATVMNKVGKDGVITVEEGQGMHFEVEYVEGLRFDRGYISAYFVTDAEEMTAVLDNPYLLFYDRRISTAESLIPLLEQLIQTGKRELVVIAEDVEGAALATLVLNTLRGAVSLLAVKAPGFGERRKEMLQDLAVLTGGKVISAEMGATLETTTLAELGRASKVLATKDYTTIIAGAGDPLAIQAHLQSLRHELEASTSDYDREKLQERLAKLSGGVAVVQVGAATETELHEKKYRLDDALHATRAAIEAGIVPGGGVALLNARAALADLRFDDADINTGVNVVRSALEVPLRRIAENAGLAGSVIMTNIYQQQRLQQNPRIGYDILTDTYVDMIEAGIPDPMKVTRSALESAASIAAMILTIEALVAEAPAGGLQRVKMP